MFSLQRRIQTINWACTERFIKYNKKTSKHDNLLKRNWGHPE